LAPFENPSVLVTRPREAAERFVAELRVAAGPFQPVVSPAFGLVSVEHNAQPFEDAIFTSKAAVSYAPDGNGRRAWCVGAATAAVAKGRGYDVRHGGGNAEDLVELILQEKPIGQLVHFCGENVRVNVTAALVRVGLNCESCVTYRKAILAPTMDVAALNGFTKSWILPIFSAETVSILSEWPVEFERAWIVAISREVEVEAMGLKPAGTIIADRPDLPEMINATARLIA